MEIGTQELATFEVELRHVEAFEARFGELREKARKLGVALPAFAVVGERVVPPVFNLLGDLVRPERVFRQIAVSGQAPRIAGFRFVAVLEHTAAGNIVRQVPGGWEGEMPEGLRTAEARCDHCRTARRRVDTYVLRSDAGALSHVGSSCLVDFLGHESPQAVAAWAEALSKFVPERGGGDSDDGEGSWGCGGAPTCSLAAYLPYVAAAIRLGGWVSRAKAKEVFPPAPSTSEQAWGRGVFATRSDIDRGVAIVPNKADCERAAESLRVVTEHLAGLGGRASDYEHNVEIVVKLGVVKGRDAGIAASIVPMAGRLLSRAAERSATRQASAHVGTIKKREVFRLTVTKVIDLVSNWGCSSLTLMRDAEGRIFKWKASAETLKVGATYDVKGTVIAHEDYKGVKQTVLSRCAVTLVPDPPATSPLHPETRSGMLIAMDRAEAAARA